MINLETIAPTAREAGVVPWMVELVLDLAGYVPDRRLAELVALEPSAGDGAFLSAMVLPLGRVLRAARHSADRSGPDDPGV